MNTPRVQKKRGPGPFSLFRFSCLIFGWSFGLFAALWVFFPDTIRDEFASRPTHMVAVFLGMSFVNGLFEYFLHRYGLHAIPAAILRGRNALFRAVFRVNAKFAREHRHHHHLTPVNNYAITTEDQYESARFPFWAMPAFFGVFGCVLFPLELLFPREPFLVAGFAAVVISYAMYETKHAFHHRPYGGWWKAWVEAPGILGSLGRGMHVGHFVHHRHAQLNNSVWGVLGFPFWDWAFGTLDLSWDIASDGVLIMRKGHVRPTPVRFIRVIDQWAFASERTLAHA